MSKVKLLLDVVEDLRSLADSVQAVADAMLQNEPTVDTEAKAPAPVPKKELTLEEVEQSSVKRAEPDSRPRSRRSLKSTVLRSSPASTPSTTRHCSRMWRC